MAQSVLLFSFTPPAPYDDYHAGSGGISHTLTATENFLTPIDVTKVVYAANAYGSTDEYSSFYNRAWDVSIELFSAGAWVEVDGCAGSSSSGGSGGCSVSGTKEGTFIAPVLYPNVTAARWTAWAQANSDHDQRIQMALLQYDIYVLSVSDTGYIV